MRFFTTLFFIFFSFQLSIGQEAIVFGAVTDIKSGDFIDYATIFIDGTTIATESDEYGKYRLAIPVGEEVKIKVSRIGYQHAEATIAAMNGGEKRYLNFKLAPQDNDLEILISESRVEDAGMVKEEVHEMKLLPTVSGNLESALPSIALGTSSGTGGELSSQYNVRGGNYDENLIYVNDFEIFRPQLIRSSQQEGLSFPNIDMIRSLSFSSGGFNAEYGDKLSSVLDIQYKRPDDFGASVGIGLLGASAHIEGSKKLGANAYNQFRYLIGGRYKTTKVVLGSLDTKGEFLPTFTDLQAYLTYDLTKSLQVGFLGNYNSNIYEFTPSRRQTTLGSFLEVLRLNTFFEGKERDRFINSTTGLSLTYLPEREHNPFFLKFLASNYLGDEAENFDISGAYSLSKIESGLGSDNFGEDLVVLGSGVQHTYTRNELYNHIYNFQHKGGIEFQLDENKYSGFKSHFLEWGVKYQKEQFEDEINEWERLDSAGYTLPINEEALTLSYVIKSENEISAEKISAFVQDSYTWRREDQAEIKITGGVRMSYRDLNDELLFSPRGQILYKPLNWNSDISFKLSGGVYYQQPFYREMRRPDGTLNTDLKSQRSIQVVSGFSYDFMMPSFSDKPFRLISELYYKKLDNLVSYDVDNVRIRYSGENDSKGYAAGWDIRVNGEFVPGAESWVNLSFLRTRESLNGVQHLAFNKSNPDEPLAIDDVPRPTDQLMNLSMFFQDYLPMNNNFKMHLNISVGSGLPYGFKGNNTIYRNNSRYKPYHRVDMGFGYQLWKDSWRHKKPNHFMRFCKNAWLSVEIFNLMKVSNQASITWIKDIQNRQYPIPNNLTSRRVNVRLKMDF